MRYLYRLSTVVFLCVLLTTPGRSADKDLRPDVPDKKTRREALKDLEDDLEEQYKLKRPEERFAFGRQLLRLGLQGGGAPGERYVQLAEAARIAGEVGDIRTLVEAIDSMGERYKIDTLEVKKDALDEAAKKVRTAETHALLCDAYWTLAEEAVTAEEYKAAVSAARDANDEAKDFRNDDMEDQTRELRRMVDTLRDLYRDYEDARKSIEKHPDDSGLCHDIGLYLVLGRGDWETGLKYLRKSDDEEWRALATLDSPDLKDPEKQYALGERYWRMAQEQWGIIRQRLKERALFWQHYSCGYLDPPRMRKTRERVSAFKLEKVMNRGLIVTWYTDDSFGRKLRSEIQPYPIDHNWGRKEPTYGISDEEFSVWHTGYIRIKESGEHFFYLSSANGSRLYLDGILVVDNWDATRPSWAIGKVDIEAGYYRIDVRMYHIQDSASLKLFWNVGKGKREAVPLSVLSHNRDAAIHHDAVRATREDILRKKREQDRQRMIKPVEPYRRGNRTPPSGPKAPPKDEAAKE